MKIALVNFPILDVGGITTYAEQIKIGFEKLGHEVQHYYAITGTRYDCDPGEKTFIGQKYKRGEKLPSEVISYGKELDKAIETLSVYEYILFVHPSPHPTKGNCENISAADWIELYRSNPSIPKATIFHDYFWWKTNKWFYMAFPYVTHIHAAQKPFYDCVMEVPTTCNKTHSLFPMEIETCEPSDERENVILVTAQWIKWKQHYKLIESLSGLSGIDVALYAGGQEYHNLRKAGELQKFLTTDVVEDEAYVHEPSLDHERVYYGFVHRDDLVERYKRALISIDPSQRGYNNYTHFEGMMYGCISFVHEKVLEHKDCTIPADCCVSYNWNNLQDKIAWVKTHPKKIAQIRRNAFNYIQGSDNRVIAQLFMDNIHCAQKDEFCNPEYIALAMDKCYDLLNDARSTKVQGYFESEMDKLLNSQYVQEHKEDYEEFCAWWVDYNSTEIQTEEETVEIVEAAAVETESCLIGGDDKPLYPSSAIEAVSGFTEVSGNKGITLKYSEASDFKMDRVGSIVVIQATNVKDLMIDISLI